MSGIMLDCGSVGVWSDVDFLRGRVELMIQTVDDKSIRAYLTCDKAKNLAEHLCVYARKIEEKRENEIMQQAPNNWAMYTKKGNDALKKKAQNLLTDISKAETFIDKANAFEKYFRSWRKLHNSKTMSESGDTAVREFVWSFALKVGKEAGLGEETINDIWEQFS